MDTLPSPSHHRNLECALIGLALALGCSGCGAAFYPDAVYVDAVPAHIETYPYTYYDGRLVYFVDGRWYYRSGPSWYYYRSEPLHLYEYRGSIHRARPAYYRREPVYVHHDGREYRHDDHGDRRPRERIEVRRSAPPARGDDHHHASHQHD